MRIILLCAGGALMLGCGATAQIGDPDVGPPDMGPVLAPEIGTGDHTASSVTFTVLATGDDDVQRPTDLAFNPRIPDDLWVVNYDDDSVVIIHEASTGSPSPEYKKDVYDANTAHYPASHFMAEPTSIAFGRDETSDGAEPFGADGIPGTFATCGDSRNHYDHSEAANDFMGVALWPSDLDVFANRPPLLPIGDLIGDEGSHLDMLHCSPQCMGLAHQEENQYWAFAGRARDPENPDCFGDCVFLSEGSAIVYYDFEQDHGYGNTNHSDGIAYQYVTGEVDRRPGVPSHLVYDHETDFLYIADTGNGRIAVLDTMTGDLGTGLMPMEPMDEYGVVEDAEIHDVVPAGALEAPSGLELYNRFLYVSDHDTGVIHAFNLDGVQVNYLDTGRGEDALSGIAFGSDGKLYLVDMVADEVLRIDP